MANDRAVADNLKAILRHQRKLRECTRCVQMNGPPVTSYPVISPVLLIGQAPGAREIQAKRPFAWTAGKTLFKWFESIGMNENAFRNRVYMAAVCRCFPGKNPKGGDRVPAREEIANCSEWLQNELQILCPQLILPVGKLAIEQLLSVDKLAEVVGTLQQIRVHGATCDVIPLPHPSGASTWHRREPGKSLLNRALEITSQHTAWQAMCSATPQSGGPV